MINVTDDFKLAMKQPVKELNAYIEIEDNNRITNENDLISFTISSESNLCKTAMRKLEARFYGDYNLIGKWVKVGFGVRTSTETFSYIEYGSFLVNEITTAKDTGITSIVAYDKMINSMKRYEPLEINYPKGLYDYTVELCNKCNLELLNSNFEVHNNWQITKELWENIEGITYRDIIQQIAQVTCTTAIIKNDKLYFKSLTNTNEKLTYDNLKKLTLQPIYGEINSVILGREPITGEDIYLKDDDSIRINGLTEFRINNNEIIDKDRENAITPIYNALHGINFYPFEAITEGLGWYEIGDNINIETDTGEIYNISLFNFVITIDGGIKETLKTAAESKTQTQYQYATSISRRLKNAEIIVNKQENTIKQITEDVDGQNEKIALVEQTVGSIQSTVTEVTQTVETVKTTANEAKTAADSVKDIADEANENANIALSTADTAIGEARDAQTYAENSNNELNQKISKSNEDIEIVKTDINTISTTLSQESSSFTAQIETINKSIEDTNKQITENETKQSKYLRYYLDEHNENKGTLELGESESSLKVKITNEEMSFTENDNKVAYINGNKLYITTAQVLNALIIGHFGFTPLSNGSLTFGKIN